VGQGTTQQADYAVLGAQGQGGNNQRVGVGILRRQAKHAFKAPTDVLIYIGYKRGEGGGLTRLILIIR